jgi:hypothetical protein
MTPKLLLSATTLLAGSLVSMAAPKDDVLQAAKKLGDQPNYSWKATVTVPEGAQFRPGPTEGKTEKDGFTEVTWTFGDNTTHAVIKGDKGAVTNQEGAWEGLADVEKEEGFARYRALMARNLKTPAVQVADIAAGMKELKKEDGAYSGELSEDAAKALLWFGRRAGADGPSVSGAHGSAKIWLKDGNLSRYEFKVKGTISFNGNDRDVDRTTTVEIKDVGTTKLTVPEAAKKNLS